MVRFKKLNVFILLGACTLWMVSLVFQRFSPELLTFVPGVDLLFIPSGIRFFLILAGGLWAASGIALGTFLMMAGLMVTSGDISGLGLSVISGFAPYFSLLATMKFCGVASCLGNLRAVHLPILGLGAGAGSSMIHCCYHVASGQVPASECLPSILAMILGDFLGTLIVTAFLLALLRIYRRFLMARYG